MSKPPTYWKKAKKILAKRDKVMAKLISIYKDGSLITRNDVFFSLLNIDDAEFLKIIDLLFKTNTMKSS